MEFDSEDAAKGFYDEYARREGFIMRIDQCRRSEVDKRILSRRLSCNKQGYYVKMKDQLGPVRKPRASTREGCKAMMLVKINKFGKWAVTRFVKEHTHPLVISDRPSRNAMDSKDRRIQELTIELERQDRLSPAFLRWIKFKLCYELKILLMEELSVLVVLVVQGSLSGGSSGMQYYRRSRAEVFLFEVSSYSSKVDMGLVGT
ncbi:hypothetical protein F0562_002218 [Nyssa sinensis]|uniref:FAR1 domain-containing protein n=1 Tax=Nyssa sinensis TaxID=561372 RepID=A0A5J5C6S1_9ASTE|nr:hypothetical protein F0562_002218 [Nyssa sinensis]